jgi:hypothetical protein
MQTTEDIKLRESEVTARFIETAISFTQETKGNSLFNLEILSTGCLTLYTSVFLFSRARDGRFLQC